MSRTTNINVRVDAELKSQAEKLFNEMGFNMSTAINMFLRQSIQYGGLPFELRLDKPNENMSKTFDTVDELMKDLDA